MIIKKVAFFIIGIIVPVIIWFNLPLFITRYSDIHRGNEIAKRIDDYKRDKGLPGSYDWKTLKQFGFANTDGENWEPQYQRINDTTYELAFADGFDGPWLVWNSSERKWKISAPSVPDDWTK